MNLSLREVNAKDIDLLYQWANDKTVRQNAFHTEQIPYADHRMWFTRNLADRDVLMYILCQVSEMGQEEPLGQIRLSIEGNQALISYTIEENAASARVFEKCGYDRKELENYIEFTKRIRS